jgi:hypothetical protein
LSFNKGVDKASSPMLLGPTASLESNKIFDVFFNASFAIFSSDFTTIAFDSSVIKFPVDIVNYYYYYYYYYFQAYVSLVPNKIELEHGISIGTFSGIVCSTSLCSTIFPFRLIEIYQAKSCCPEFLSTQ